MESAEAKVRIVHVVRTTVLEVKRVHSAEKNGWWVHFLGSRESLFFDGDEPPFAVADRVKISFTKEP